MCLNLTCSKENSAIQEPPYPAHTHVFSTSVNGTVYQPVIHIRNQENIFHISF